MKQTTKTGRKKATTGQRFCVVYKGLRDTRGWVQTSGTWRTYAKAFENAVLLCMKAGCPAYVKRLSAEEMQQRRAAEEMLSVSRNQQSRTPRRKSSRQEQSNA